MEATLWPALGVTRVANSFGRSCALPTTQVGLGFSTPVPGMTLFLETRIGKAFDADSFPSWAITTLAGGRLVLSVGYLSNRLEADGRGRLAGLVQCAPRNWG